MGRGTLRTGRMRTCKLKSEKELKEEGRRSFDDSVDLNSGCCIVRWFDKKPVQLALDYVFIDPMDSVQRWSKSERKMISVPRPHIVKKYNASMGGVDLFDMFQSLYRMDHKSKRWYIRIFYWILASSVMNAWLRYQKDYVILDKKGQFHDNRDKNLTLIQFSVEVSSVLMKNAKLTPKKRVGRHALNDISSSLDKSFSPKRPTKAPDLREVIPDIKYDKHEHWPIHRKYRPRCFLCKEKRGWAVQNVKKVFV